MLAKVKAAALSGLGAVLVTVEVDLSSKGFPTLNIVGLPDKAVGEAKERVRAAIVNSGITFPEHRITVNLAPADLPKEGSSYDLAIAVGILAAIDQVNSDLTDKLFVGELALDGGIRPIPGALLIAKLAAEAKIAELFLPKANLTEASLIDSVSFYTPITLVDLLAHLTGGVILQPASPLPTIDFEGKRLLNTIGLSEIKGQEKAKRALEIAAAGGHNLRLVGPPGTGKTLLAQALISILPPLIPEEVIELTGIYSAFNRLPQNGSVIAQPPFRSPHHTTSYVGMIGGGTNPQPGEITLAHRGVLFLDELPEFSRNVLEALRQPLEDGQISIARSGGKRLFPAKFILVAAHNPCPCGFRGARIIGKTCRCRVAALDHYQRKLSGPILDRIDLHVKLKAIPPEQLAAQSDRIGDKTRDIRKTVRQARERQRERFKEINKTLNKDLSPAELNRFCRLSPQASCLLNQAMVRRGLSARGYHRVIKVARTIADLDGVADVRELDPSQVSEALSYRWEVDDD